MRRTANLIGVLPNPYRTDNLGVESLAQQIRGRYFLPLPLARTTRANSFVGGPTTETFTPPPVAYAEPPKNLCVLQNSQSIPSQKEQRAEEIC